MKHLGWLLLLTILSCSPNREAIRIKGSDTEVNLAVLLGEAFHMRSPGAYLSISGGGSGLGIASLLNGTTDIANSSRRINREEIDLFQQKGIRIDSFIFAQDAIAFVVSDESHLDSVTLEQLASLLSGEYDMWDRVSGRKLPVTIYGRQSNSGTHDFVKQRLNIRFSPRAREMNGNAQILEAVRTDPSGIGYVGAGYVNQDSHPGIKVLLIQRPGGPSVSPFDQQTIASGEYPFQRPLFQYFKASSSRKVAPFLEFEQSERGRRIIQEAGYYPVMKKP
jgi:phosphate transport system substrate-binding protein